jgi:hypothetical protein
MKRIRKAALILLLLFSSFSISYGIDISLRLSGGLCTLKLDNINHTLKGWVELWKNITLSRDDWEFAGGEAKKFNAGYDFDGEILVSLSRHIAASFGVGFIYGELAEEKIEVFINTDSSTSSIARPTKVNARPLTLSAYFFYPLGKKLDLFVKGGTGLIWSKYIEREGGKSLTADHYDFWWHQQASAQGPVFLGGIGIIYRIDSSLSFIIEGGARRAKISGFRGETPEGEEGDLYFFEEYNSDFDFWQAKYLIFTEEPTGETFRSVRKADVDFSGFSAKIGLLIKF